MSTFKSGQKIMHDHYGEGTIIRKEDVFYVIDFGKRGIIEISRRSEDMMHELPEEESMENGIQNPQKAILDILESYFGPAQPVDIAGRWEKGTLIIQPDNKDLKPKEVPLEAFYGKIIRLRDRLRVLEQHINSHNRLSAAEKIDFQHYLTQIYGTLTTFNFLFKNDEDHFVGEKKSNG